MCPPGELALVGARIGLPLSSTPVISFPLIVVDPVPVSDPLACRVSRIGEAPFFTVMFIAPPLMETS